MAQAVVNQKYSAYVASLKSGNQKKVAFESSSDSRSPKKTSKNDAKKKVTKWLKKQRPAAERVSGPEARVGRRRHQLSPEG